MQIDVLIQSIMVTLAGYIEKFVAKTWKLIGVLYLHLQFYQ